MCTLLVAFRQFESVPLVIAANRDERLERPAQAPFAWPGEPFLAPRDLEAGGSWLGITRGGMFVGVTNRFGAAKEPSRASRGRLVIEALRKDSAVELHEELSALSPTRFNAFHLLYADSNAAFVTWSDGEGLFQQELGPGVHVVTERSMGGDDHARTELVRSRWRELAGRAPPSPEQLRAMLSVHAEDPVGGTCVHVPALGYGTRSSLILFLAEAPGASRMFWAEGPPCVTPLVERSELLGTSGA